MTNAWPPGRTFWTTEFPERTNDRTTPFLFKGIVPPAAAIADDVLDGFAVIRHAHTADTGISAHARVYVGEERRDDLLDRVLAAPAWTDGGFVTWMQELVAAERFSVVINNLETISPALAAGLGHLLASLFDGWGVPLGGAELVAFAGNYSGTAFGVHEGYEDAFLTHYGPGVKHFYTWSNEEYQKLTGGQDPLYGDYLWLLDHAKHFVLEPGDALFLPRRVFHVGRQDEFSVSIAMPLYTYPDAAILRAAVLPDLLEAHLTGGPDTELGQPSPMTEFTAGTTPVTRRLTALATRTLNSAGRHAERAVERHLRQRWNTLLSNGGWEMVQDDLARAEAATAFDPNQVTAGATVAVTAPYRLIVDGDQAFLRGCEITTDPDVLTPELVTAVNTAPLTLPADDNVLTAVRALGATGGLTATPAPKETSA
ncbi:hypothetical protein Q0Z83_039450 [Actinoplanes sichuanensis]|uniref:JmjC domain-containing protein n=1 Tax=Actinoplanes sichuanensis TaxID=512349 RepID=A0ABW4A358_9ACTN|nr:cupin domain-containing protein [Actinoplanes sichuanensis]BEL05754.1 hypothetical protein Q0Z83_039450 [Actinoplanes sichuanensis]